MAWSRRYVAQARNGSSMVANRQPPPPPLPPPTQPQSRRNSFNVPPVTTPQSNNEKCCNIFSLPSPELSRFSNIIGVCTWLRVEIQYFLLVFEYFKYSKTNKKDYPKFLQNFRIGSNACRWACEYSFTLKFVKGQQCCLGNEDGYKWRSIRGDALVRATCEPDSAPVASITNGEIVEQCGQRIVRILVVSSYDSEAIYRQLY